MVGGGGGQEQIWRVFRRLFVVIQVRSIGNTAARGGAGGMERSRQLTETFRECISWGSMMY